MAITYGFYNSQDGDRKYNAVQMSSIFDGIIEDGIFQSIGTAMAVTASTGKTVVVGVGRAWFDHTWTLNDSGYPIELPESEVLLDRIDAVVLEVDASVAVRANSFKVVEGAPASNPQRPSLVNNETTHQHALAYILRKAGTEEVTQADITNVIGTSETPYVTGPLSIITADAMLAQWQSEFDQWFESLEDTLSGDVAANLANQIMQKVDKTSVIDDLDEIAATTEEGYVAGALAVKDLNSKRTVLYDTPISGEPKTYALDKSANGYDALEIHVRNNNDYGGVFTVKASGLGEQYPLSFVLSMFPPSGMSGRDASIWCQSSRFQLSSDGMTITSVRSVQVKVGVSPSQSNTACLFIEKVVGIKY